ncbi:unnamed protein product [Boreogadus saida]
MGSLRSFSHHNRSRILLLRSHIVVFLPTGMSGVPDCCICLRGLTRPVSQPCHHAFCLACIGEYWRITGCCQCPLCKALFPTRPDLVFGVPGVVLPAAPGAALPRRRAAAPPTGQRPEEL